MIIRLHEKKHYGICFVANWVKLLYHWGDGTQGGTSGTDRSLASRATREFWHILAHIISLLVV
jgi:hypothetical protein